jgi:bacteriocin-like protein
MKQHDSVTGPIGFELNDEDLKSISGGATVRKTVHDVKKAGGFAIRNAVLDLGGGFAIRNAVLKLAK